MDYRSLLYDPIYFVQGVPVVLRLSNGVENDMMTALDKTAGINVGDNAQVPTILPAAMFRVKELQQNNISVEDLPDATLEMNEFVWTVTNYRLKPSPRGQNDGEVILMLDERRKVSP